MTTTKTYDKLNRMTGMISTPTGGGQLPFSYGSSYNEANQRITVTMNDGSYWVYEYDTLGQIKSAKKHFADGTFVPGQQFTYSHSNIGNRTETTVGGTETGGNSGINTYQISTNKVNQYLRKYGALGYNILGTAHPGSNVVVNGSSVNYRRGEYFWKWMSVTSSTSPRWLPVEVTSGSQTNGNIFMPGRPEYFTYDLDGNMLSDGRWNYTWDAENRLTSMTDNTTCTNDVPKRIVFEYDYQGRRIAKKVWNNTAGTNDPIVNLKYLYDGWNLIAELDGNNSLVRSYTWGLDASGSMQGAGGVGGLLMVNAGSSGVHFPAYDLNGNVMGLVNATNGIISAKYEYGPFGEVFCSVGDMAEVNPFGFSTKYTDNETDLLYYGYRYYSPALGRWLSRDPIEEKGGLNLYAFVNNDPVNKWDLYGFSPYCVCVRAATDHAWIHVFDMGKKNENTYSRYKKKYGNPPADHSGVLKNMDLTRHYDVQRCVQVDLFSPKIDEGYDCRRNNCVSYAASEWKRVSGEDLNITGRKNIPDDGQGGRWIYDWFDSPEIIVESIRKSNEGSDSFSTCCEYPPRKGR